MVTLLVSIFIKDKENVNNPSVRRSYGMLCSIVGICLNVILFAGKYFAGVVSGSIAITADAFNNLSDAGSSIITLVGFKFAGMKPDKDHPYGHGRIEYVSGFIVSMVILLMGMELAKSSIEKIISPEAVDTSFLAMGILIVSIIVKIYMALYNTRISKKINSHTMKATATDSLSDTIATTVVLISMLVMKYTHINIDGVSGIIVAIFILLAGYNSAKDTVSPLLGQAPDEKFIQEIKTIVMAHDEIIGIHDIIVHDYGPGRIMISLHGEVAGNGDIYELHDAIDRIENELSSKLSCEAVIHMDPIAVDDADTMELREQVGKLISDIDSTLSMHDFRIVKGPTHTNLIFDIVVPTNIKYTDEELKNIIEKSIKELNINYYVVMKIDRLYL